ncbi:MAG: hypothetical protein IJD97_10265 [Clostridia bacterium]|nr:hypothetical protein [Clostridia bacterium]
MDKFSKLQKMPLKEGYDYISIKKYSGFSFEDYEEMMEELRTPFTTFNVVKTAYHEDWEDDMNEHGMTKFALVLSGLLYMIEKNEVHRKHAFEVLWDILDFETGEYDDLFTPEDLKLIKADVKKVMDFINKKYLKENPDLMENTIRRRREAQAE